MIRWLNGTIDSVNMSEQTPEQTPGDSEGQGCLAKSRGSQRVRQGLATEQQQQHWYLGLLGACKSFQSCPTLCDPMDHSLPGSSVYGILQARILKRVAMPFSRGFFLLRDETYVSYVSCLGMRVLYHCYTSQ